MRYSKQHVNTFSTEKVISMKTGLRNVRRTTSDARHTPAGIRKNTASYF